MISKTIYTVYKTETIFPYILHTYYISALIMISLSERVSLLFSLFHTLYGTYCTSDTCLLKINSLNAQGYNIHEFAKINNRNAVLRMWFHCIFSPMTHSIHSDHEVAICVFCLYVFIRTKILINFRVRNSHEKMTRFLVKINKIFLCLKRNFL